MTWNPCAHPWQDIYDRVRSCALLADDRAVWRKLLISNWGDTALENAPAVILQDKELMLLACSRHAEVYGLLDFPLNEDRDILEVAVKCASKVLAAIPHRIQVQHPDLVAMAIRQWDGDLLELLNYINEEVWSNLIVARAWVSKGGLYLYDQFDVAAEKDMDIFLLIAEHNPQDFQFAADCLCGDKDFMLQIVAKNPTLFLEALNSIFYDFDIALEAFGGGDDDEAEDAAKAAQRRDLAGSFDFNNRTDFEFITGFAAKVRERLVAHDNFVKVVLCAMSPQTKSNNKLSDDEGHLRTLDQGSETFLAYRVLLAQFMGIPVGRELRLLRRTSVNLAAWGY